MTRSPLRSLASAGLLTLVVAAGLVAARAPRGTRLSLKRESGLEQRKTFTSAREFEMQDFSMTVLVDDEEQPTMPSVPEVTVQQSLTVEFIDSFDSVEDGQVTGFTRTFETLSGTYHQEVSAEGVDDEEEDTELSSPFADTAIVFTWDADDESFEAAFSEESTGDDELLAGLAALSDFSVFLPDDEVEPGDTWEVGAAAYEQLFHPVGEVRLRREDANEAQDEITAELRENAEGGAKCEFVEVREEDDVQVAVVRVVLEIETQGGAEFSDTTPWDAEAELSEAVTVSIEMEGELLWNLAAGHLHSCSLDGEAEFAQTLGQSFSTPDGRDIQTSRSSTFAGPIRIDASVEER